MNADRNKGTQNKQRKRTMNTQTIKNAIAGKSPQLAILADAIEGGRGYEHGKEIYLSKLTYTEQCASLGLAAKYPEHVVALVTHDLSSAIIKNIGGLIEEIRIGN